MKLSIEQYNEIFKNRSITDYTKFNWAGEMPVLKDFEFEGCTTIPYSEFDLERGKKYVFEVVGREIIGDLGSTQNHGFACISTDNTAKNTFTGTKSIQLVPDDPSCTGVYCYCNGYNYVHSFEKPIKVKVRISEYVEFD